MNGATLTIYFTENLDDSAAPAPSAFTVMVDPDGDGAQAAARRNVAANGVAIADDAVTLTLASPVGVGETVTVAYAKPGSNPLKGEDTNQVASFGAQSATNETPEPDATPPPLGVATVNGDQLDLVFNEDLDTGSVPAASAFTVTVAGASRSVSGVAIPTATSGSLTTNVVRLTLASAVTAGEAVTVAYAAPGTNPLQDASGNGVATISATSVFNLTPSPIALRFGGASVDGTNLKISFQGGGRLRRRLRAGNRRVRRAGRWQCSDRLRGRP